MKKGVFWALALFLVILVSCKQDFICECKMYTTRHGGSYITYYDTILTVTRYEAAKTCEKRANSVFECQLK